ncbi:hypothetical protein SAMN02910291_00076 [Desulfovibrio desulfuricans]|uniref:Uncharacterized protein n=1 Tax=Desulfovibrio desulfuricans TaxID=876 RepID=A0AA94HPZ7_DESDE|nr:hypothetical protein SAMN02910291_00076 [Desulfovibrio desulfuricans]SPD35817.1 Hypothetical protein DSVG11_1720 [Desulfovibrio sp. G11]
MHSPEGKTPFCRRLLRTLCCQKGFKKPAAVLLHDSVDLYLIHIVLYSFFRPRAAKGRRRFACILFLKKILWPVMP